MACKLGTKPKINVIYLFQFYIHFAGELLAPGKFTISKFPGEKKYPNGAYHPYVVEDVLYIISPWD